MDFTIYNFPKMPPQWDRVGIFYITFCLLWTLFLIAGIVFCWLNRRDPILKIRGLPLSLSAIAFLHAYWILAQIVYPIGRSIQTVLAYDIQYFFMGIWFPLGIALFHASNCRFLHVAEMQRQFAHPTLRKPGCSGKHSSWLCRLRNMSYSWRIFILIAPLMILQVLLTVGMWLACRKYHPTYGLPGTEIRGKTFPEQLQNLSIGWEWWPSVLWQVVWTWIVAPILLWRAWGIRDTLGWRAQTIGCCIFSLHATPMFLIASYSPAFAKVNMYFAPSEWIHLSIMIFEIFTVFVPVFLVVRANYLRRQAAASNLKWETCSQSTLRSSTYSYRQKTLSSISLAEKENILEYLDDKMGDRLLSMGALDHVLRDNPMPLQEFSALSDFSGENIAFLSRVSQWKATGCDPVESFNIALNIYIDFVSPRDAEFPLNLSSNDLKALEAVFERPTRIICGDAMVNSATLFDCASSVASIRATYTGAIPEDFDSAVFDNAQKHIKYLVLTNTWPKFLASLRNGRRSSESGRSESSSGSERTLGSGISRRLSALLEFSRDRPNYS